MLVTDFNTKEEARVAFTITYRKIGGNEASQLLAKRGALDSIEASTASTIPVNLVENDPTTIGALCRTIIRTLSGGVFATDPGTVDGATNRGLCAVLVLNNITTQVQMDEFFQPSRIITYPFENITTQDFEIAKGLFNKIPVIVQKGYCTITTTADTESHRPQIYREIEFDNGDKEYIRIAGFGPVTQAGLYRVQCPSFPVVYIDDHYDVITQA